MQSPVNWDALNEIVLRSDEYWLAEFAKLDSLPEEDEGYEELQQAVFDDWLADYMKAWTAFAKAMGWSDEKIARLAEHDAWWNWVMYHRRIPSEAARTSVVVHHLEELRDKIFSAAKSIGVASPFFEAMGDWAFNRPEEEGK